ncbi:hypothetical protein NEHOM01_1683 [Nematocida homosporus]|uniref:uncharacterized protein n=1 Tax=Nematocida homosporus TaxID=1912981 RepID=UPI00221F04AD|nr:uncharacterized protein NEHOM01_1683 [Nematocida homosporus]KAI5186752.1 hypothetical protein NEHOM01_1683 [Nematocida homosporus]
MSPIVISEVYSLSTVKHTLDDVLVGHLVVQEGYKEDTFSADVKIVTGLFLSLLTIVLLVLSLKCDFSTYKSYAATIVILFWVISYLESFLSKFFFGYTFLGRSDKDTIKILTKIDSPKPIYTLLVYFNKKEIPNKTSLDITKIVNQKGELNQDLFVASIKEALLPSSS